MNQTVVGLFNTASEAQAAVEQLKSNGFSNNDVDLSIGSSNGAAGTVNTGSSGTDSSRTNFNLDKDDEKESGVSRFFKNLFGSDDDDDTSNSQANRYSQYASRGNSIVTVHTTSANEAERAADILDECGAANVDEDADGYNNYDTNTGAAPVGVFNETSGATATTPDSDYDVMSDNSDKVNQIQATSDNDTTGATSIPIIEENLQVGKRTVETGGARLRSRIVERQVEENLRLREERVYVNRNPVNRPATSSDFDTFKEGQVELKEYAEVPVVSKEARVVEEVSLGKEATERSETVRDSVRKTEVDVEQIPGSTTSSSSSDDRMNRKDN